MTAAVDANCPVMQPEQARTFRPAERTRRDAAMTGMAPEYRQRRARAIAQGTWQPLAADPEPVREHVRQLRTSGASYQAIGEAADVSAMTVHALINGTGRVSTHTADALMGLTPSHLNPDRVPALGTTRRIRALVA